MKIPINFGQVVLFATVYIVCALFKKLNLCMEMTNWTNVEILLFEKNFFFFIILLPSLENAYNIWILILVMCLIQSWIWVAVSKKWLCANFNLKYLKNTKQLNKKY